MKSIYLYLLPVFFLLSSCQQSQKEPGLYSFQNPETEYYGFKDADGKIIIPAQYTGVDNGIAGDHEGPPEVYFVDRPYEIVSKNRKKFAIDQTGKPLFRAYWFDNGPDYFKQGLSRFVHLKKDKIGFMDNKGKEIIPAIFDWASPFRNDTAFVCNGCIAVPIRPIKFVAATGEQIYEYKKLIGGKWGAIDKRGQVTIPLKYDSGKQVETALKEKGIKS